MNPGLISKNYRFMLQLRAEDTSHADLPDLQAHILSLVANHTHRLTVLPRLGRAPRTALAPCRRPRHTQIDVSMRLRGSPPQVPRTARHTLSEERIL